MTERDDRRSPLVLARLAGALGLLILAAGTFASSVFGRLVVPGDPATTASRVAASESLFRLGSVSLLAMYTLFVVYAWLLYRLMRPSGRDLALLMLLLALAGVPIGMLGEVGSWAVVLLLGDASFMAVATPEQARAMAAFFLELRGSAALVGVIFWGLWLFPLGLLVYRSGYLPRLLGVLLMVGCFGYLLLFVQRVFLPDLGVLGHARYAAHAAELALILWLLVKGVNGGAWEARARRAAVA